MADADTDPESLVGTTVNDGRYAISGLLGVGSQGATYEAVDKQRGELIALKRYQVRGAQSWKDVELAEREAEVLMRLDHPLVPRAVERFEEDGALFLAMERIEGESLRDAKNLDRREVIRFLGDAARVLDYLHNRTPPVIHRDIKPAHVIRRVTGGKTRYTLVDFGSVKNRLEPKGGSTVVGTFGYMAPEQLQGRALPQTDVYAVGATAMRLLTGIEPEDLPHDGLAIDVAKALGRDHPLTPVLEKMLAPNPDERAARIGPLLAELHEKNRTSAPPRTTRRSADTPNRPDDRPVDLPPVVKTLVLVALTIIRVLATVGVGVLVPTLLTILSVFFGKQLRRAAHDVVGFHRRLDDRIAKGMRSLSQPPPERARRRRRRGKRIAADGVESGKRIVNDEIEAKKAELELEIEMESQIEEERERAAARRRNWR